MARPRVYLAGPDVFLPDAAARAAILKAACAEHGLTGIFPLDPLDTLPADWATLPEARQIALANETHIRNADAMIANLTPFRGPSADAGTVFEIGFMRALGRPIFGWSNAGSDFLARTLAFIGPTARLGSGNTWRDTDDMLVESFGLTDNLMIDGAILASGGSLFTAETPHWTDLTTLHLCLAAAARVLGEEKKEGQGAALDPPKAGGLWKPPLKRGS
jgi:nucleoside 2-deoxyribosyltransferase